MPLPRPLILTILGLVNAVISASYCQGNAFTPPIGHTGAPGHLSCMECHGSNQGSGTVSLSFSGNTEYEAGQLYSINVKVEDPAKIRFGFSMVSRETANDTVSTGTWSAGTPDTQTYGVAEQHVGHKQAPFVAGSHTFTVNWTAPPEGTGDVTFYVAANAANGTGTAGDNIYLTTLTISEMADPPPPSLTDPKKLPNGTMQFVLNGDVNTTYQIEFFDNILQWQSLEKITLNSSSQLVSDPAAANAPARLYRAREDVP